MNFPYTLTMLSAIFLCGWLLRRSQRALPLQAWEKLGIGMGAFCGAMLGAKLPFVLADPQGMWDGTAWFSHGKTIMSGLVGGYFGVETAKWALQVHVKTGDSFAVPVAIAVAIGRLGCFVGGCCYGVPTELPWGVHFPTAGDTTDVFRHPTQIYEALFHLMAAGLLALLAHQSWLQFQQIKLYLILYLLFRFVTEFLRPEPAVFSGMTGYQCASVLLIPLFVGLWMRDAQKGNSKPA